MDRLFLTLFSLFILAHINGQKYVVPTNPQVSYNVNPSLKMDAVRIPKPISSHTALCKTSVIKQVK